MPDKNPTPLTVIIPLLNPNEPEARLAALHVSAGQAVNEGDLLCTLETTKSTFELIAEIGGFICTLQYQAGESVRAGEILCYIAPSPDWQPDISPAVDSKAENIPTRLRITQPALTLARSNQLDLEQLPSEVLVTEALVEELLISHKKTGKAILSNEYDSNAILIYGGGGHGKSLIELIRHLGKYQIAGVIDDGKLPGEKILDVPVLGGATALTECHRRGIRMAANAVGGIGDIHARMVIFERLRSTNFACPILVHPSAVIEDSAKLAEGVQVFPQAYIGSATRVGFGVIVNTGAIVSHDCILADYVNISPGAMLAGEVRIGERVLVGMGATLNLQVRVGAGARIGNGATVKSAIPENGIVHAGSIWPE
jgi:acetyltransferase EpsM